MPAPPILCISHSRLVVPWKSSPPHSSQTKPPILTKAPNSLSKRGLPLPPSVRMKATARHGPEKNEGKLLQMLPARTAEEKRAAAANGKRGRERLPVAKGAAREGRQGETHRERFAGEFSAAHTTFQCGDWERQTALLSEQLSAKCVISHQEIPNLERERCPDEQRKRETSFQI